MKPLSGVLYSLYRGQPNHGPWVVGCLEGGWARILGERLAAVCRPVWFRDSDLLIEITDGGWERAVRGVKAELLEKIRAATAGEVRGIRFGAPPGPGE